MKKSEKNQKNWAVSKWTFVLALLSFVFVGISAQAQQTVTGTVSDGAGKSIPMVSVLVKGTSIGISADDNGAYSITIPANVTDPVLIFSFIGFTDKEEVVGNRTVINATLTGSIDMLDEVVVVGYGTQKRSSITGAVSSIKAEALKTRPVASVSAALAGQMAGVTSIQTSGAPGSQDGTITIRGKNSVNAASPLIIIDGIPADMTSANSIDPSDVESISTLKDAASAAIYGVQAANGVILITTKKGRKGQDARVNYSATVAWATPTTKLDFLGSGDYAMLYREAELNEDTKESALKYTLDDIQKYYDGAPGYYNTDWYKETFKSSSFEHMHNLSLSGGSEKSNYNASVGYVSQDGLIKNNSFERFTGRLNVESRVTDWISVGLNASGYRRITDEPWEGFGSVLQYANRLNPTHPVYVDNDPSQTYFYSGYQNPVAMANLNTGFRNNIYQQIHATLHGTIYFMPNLTLKGAYSVRNMDRTKEEFKAKVVYGAPGSISDSGDREGRKEHYDYNWYTTQLLANYNETWGKHSIALLAGFEQNLYTHKYTKAWRTKGGSDALPESLNTLDPATQQNEGGGNEIARRSYFGRANYTYADKYIVEATLRADASSIFPKSNRWGYFPAVSGAWIISREGFMQDINWLNHLKLRGGWGQTGNEEIDMTKKENHYPASPSYAFDKIILNNTLYSTTKEARYSNPNLKWATVSNYDLGIEANFLDSKIGFDLGLYKKTTKDMLLPLAVSGSLGLSAPLQNAGSVENIGMDLQIFHNLSVNKDFSYSLKLNMAYVRNKITGLNGANAADPDYNKKWRIEGEAIGSFYGYKALGFFNTQADLDNFAQRTGKEKLGDIRYNQKGEKDKDRLIGGDDREVIGKDFPSLTMGFGADFFYKNWDFSFFLQGSFNYERYFVNEAAYAFFNGGKVLERHLDRWTPTNHNASYPRITRGDQKNFATSSFWCEDASYLRLKNVTLGYNLPQELTQKIGIQRVKVYFSGENLLTFTGLEGIDPEAPNSNDNRGAYYGNVRKFSLGLQVTF